MGKGEKFDVEAGDDSRFPIFGIDGGRRDEQRKCQIRDECDKGEENHDECCMANGMR